MEPTDAATRPRQVTVGGWFVIASAVFLVISVFDSMAALHSVDVRAQIARALSSSSGRGLGVSVDGAQSMIRVVLMLAGAGGAAAVVLGVFVLQRNKAARVALGIVMLPVLLGAPFSGVFPSALLIGSTLLLWGRPARDWFAGRTPRATARPVAAAPTSSLLETTPPPDESTPARPPQQPTPTRPPTPPPTPPPTEGFGGRPPPYAGPTPPVPPTSSYTGPPAWSGSVPAKSVSAPPGAVRAAAILTWVFAGLTGAAYALILVVLVVGGDSIVSRIQDTSAFRGSKLRPDLVRPALYVGSGIVLVWCLVACVLAYFVWRGHSWACYLLVVSAAVGALISGLTLPFSLAHLAAMVTAIGLLLTRRAREWFRSTSDRGWAPGPPMYPWPEMGSGAPGQPPPAPPAPAPHSGEPTKPEGKPPVW